MSRHDIKHKRLETAYKQTISRAIVTQLDDERLKDDIITITRVEIKDDYSVASVYFTLLNKQKKNKILKALYSASPYFLNILKGKVKIRYLPPMKFFYDEKGEQADAVLGLIDELTKDLTPEEDTTDEQE